jgi:AP-1-like transcription factor
MDFSHNFYAGGAAPQPYQFIGVPPLTPSHSNNSAASENYNNQSPPVRPVPSRLVFFLAGSTDHHLTPQEVYENFQPIDQYGQYNNNPPPFARPPGPPTPPIAPSHGQSQNGPITGAAIAPAAKDHQADISATTKADPEPRQNASNSEDEDLPPAQSRRKAQNRAAYVLPCPALPCPTSKQHARTP